MDSAYRFLTSSVASTGSSWKISGFTGGVMFFELSTLSYIWSTNYS